MLDFPSYTSFRTKFGAPFRRSGKCSVQLNQGFFAALLSSEEKTDGRRKGRVVSGGGRDMEEDFRNGGPRHD